jgi:cellobiose-specific phosphotransferase system component IIA
MAAAYSKERLVPGHNAVTRLLQQSRVGDKSAFNQLMPFVYQQLRKLAATALGLD